ARLPRHRGHLCPRDAVRHDQIQPPCRAVLHADRAIRSLLALRGYRLDLPVPAALSDRLSRSLQVVADPSISKRGSTPQDPMSTGSGGAMSAADTSHARPVSLYAKTFLTLFALMILTVVAARFHLGPFNVVVAMAIAAVKATLVVLFFMDVKFSSRLVWAWA